LTNVVRCIRKSKAYTSKVILHFNFYFPTSSIHKGQFGFEVLADNRIYLFRTKTSYGADHWIETLRTFIDPDWNMKVEVRRRLTLPRLKLQCSGDPEKIQQIIDQTVKFSLDDLDLSGMKIRVWSSKISLPSAILNCVKFLNLSDNFLPDIPRVFNFITGANLSNNSIAKFPSDLLEFPALTNLIIKVNIEKENKLSFYFKGEFV